jgi:hypothetical protein
MRLARLKYEPLVAAACAEDFLPVNKLADPPPPVNRFG